MPRSEDGEFHRLSVRVYHVTPGADMSAFPIII